MTPESAAALAAIGDLIDRLIEASLLKYEAILLEHSDDTQDAINEAVAEQHRALLAERRRTLTNIEAEIRRRQTGRDVNDHVHQETV